MDSYDLFGEDVGAGMLDGLPDLGSDGFDPTPGQPPSQQPQQQSGPGASGGSAGSRTAPPPYGQMEHLSSMSQENSLQKMSTFGEYGGHHRPSPQQHHMDGQGGMYGSPASQLNHHHHQQQHLAGAGYDTSGAMIGGGAPPSGQLCGPVTYQNPGTSGSGGTMRTNQFPAFCSPNDGGIYGLDQGGMVGRNETSGVEVGGAGGNDGIRGGGGWNGSASQSYQVGGGNTYGAQMGPQQDPYRQQMSTYSQQRQPEGQELGYCGQDPIMTGGPGVGMSRGYPPMQQRVPGFSDVGGGAENPCAGAGVYQGPGVSGTMGQQQVGQGYVGYNQTHHHVQYSAQQQQGSGCEMDVVNQQTPQYNHVQMPQQHVTPVMGPAGHHHSFVSHRMQVPPVANHRHYVAPQHGMPQQQKVQQLAAGSGEGSPQYRTNFPQHSPQMSPRTGSIQQRVGSPGPPRMSPRPSQIPQQQLMQMSPGKPCLSPHPGQTTMSPRPPAALTPKASPSAGYPQVNPVVGQSSPVPAMPQQSTLQRLEQMVGPPAGSEYQQNQYLPDGMNALNNPTLVVPNSNQGHNLPPQRVLSSLPTSSPLAVPSMQWGSTGHVQAQPMGMDITGNSVPASETVPHQMRGPPVSGDPRISQAMGNSSNAQTHVGDESNGSGMQGMGGLPVVDPSCNIATSPRIQGPEDVSLVPPIAAESEQSMGISEFPAVTGSVLSVEQSSAETSAVQKTGNMGTDRGDLSNGSYGTYDGVGGGDGCGVQMGSTPVDMPCPDPRFSGPVSSVGPYPAAGADGVSTPMPACPPGSVATAVPSNISTTTSTLDKPPDMNNSGFPHVAESPMQPGAPVLALPPGLPPHGGIPLHFDHQQEMSSLQQQLRELFCMPAQQPIPEVQEKVVRLQERLHILQQHMAQDHCSGGPQCILGPPTLPGMLPGDGQVTPAKGRGKGGTGTPKPKKSRKKKEEGAQTPGEVAIGPDGQPIPPAEAKPKKPKTPRKPREPKKPKEPKPPKEPKKKKEPKPPGEGKTPSKPRKSRSKKKEGAAAATNAEAGATPAASGESQPATAAVPAEGEGIDGAAPAAEVATAIDGSPPAENAEGTTVATTPEVKAEKSAETTATPAESTPGTEAGTPSATGEGTDGGTPATAKPKKPKRDRTKGKSARLSTTPKIRNAKGMFSSFKKKTKNKGESEASDLEVTPPPSPEPEADNGVQKRRSARNTHRKKYVDDIELAISEDELHGLLPLALASSAATGGASVSTPSEEPGAGSPTQGEGAGGVSGGSGESSVTAPAATEPSKRRRNPAPAPAGGEEEAEGVVKPNFVYINTTDEDSMIVQHVLAVRMGKREIRKGIPKVQKEGESSNVSKEEEAKKEGTTEEKQVESEAQPKEEEKQVVGEIKVEDTPTEEAGANQSVVEVENIVKEVKEEAKEISQEEKTEGDGTLKPEKAVDADMEVAEGKQKEECGMDEKEAKPKEDSKPKDETKEEDEESEDEDVEVEVIDVEEYFVKYRNFSYLHCEWKTEEELMKGDKRIPAKIKRFKQKMGQNTNIFENLEDEPFNPDYVEVDRVLDAAEHKDPNTGKTTKNYLVKWKGLQYEDATWELEEDIDPSKVQQFEIFRELPPKDQWKPKKKPTGEQWEKLDVSPVYKNDNTLRAYQLEGLNWLLFSWYNGRNCILADEMGLGKTIQSIAFINAVYQWGIKRPFLVVAPLSTIPNWQREFEAWTDMNVIVYHGSTASRNMLQEYEMFYRDEKGCPMKDLPKFNVLITTFEIIIADCLELREFAWRLCVIDEAHRLKNRNCKLLEGLRLLNLEHRVLLSGTPLQNNVNELFSLLNFLEPSQFGSSESFLQEFGALKSETEVQKLQALLKPMMLRRLKEDVEKTIAPKEETVIEVELTNIQKKYYRAILERNFSFLSKGTTTANVPNLMNTMMELRKCCIHPYLLNGAEEQIQLEYKQTNGEDPDAYFKALIHSSGKMVLIDKLLPKLKANGHRVLVFSQMVRCLDILEDYLMFRKYPFERIDGRIRGNLRQAAIDRYCKPDSDRFVFLLCTKAGGLGINLTAADTVIIYDSDWNPQNDLQAQARCHRIGQQKMVKVYRLLCRNTYEREMFDKASLKLGLDRAVLQSMNTAQGGKDPAGTAVGQKQLSKKEIEDLLKKGAYGAIMEEDNAGDKFCEEDIDQILERRTQVITLETGEKGSTFSKASFASSGIRSDIDIDDPDFWKKWAKKADIDMSEGGEKNELVISEPRRRTQIKRYGHDESLVDMSELDSSSDSDDEAAGRRCQRSSKFGRRPRSLSKYYDGDHIPREGEIVYGSWARSECFKVEKGLLTFGWGRWPEILAQGQFRRGWRESDVEDCARVILLYCLRFYHGDDKIKGFIWDLITPTENGESRIQRNHMGLSAPVPRGRKGKKKMKEARMLNAMMEINDWSRNEKYDGDIFLENNYKKHLTRHANKVLLRVRMLYYIKHEIIGDLVQQIAEGVPVNLDEDKISEDEDDCMVVEGGNVPPNAHGGQRQDEHGIHHHANQEHHLTPEETLLRYQQSQNAAMAQGQYSGMSAEHAQHNHNMMAQLADGSQQDDRENSAGGTWPSVADLNTRLRRVITSYQRNYKKEELKMAQKAKAAAAAAMPDCRRWPQKMDRKEKMEQMLREREKSQLDLSQRRWSRREEQDFYRTVSTFGVEYDRKRGRYDWNRFRTISHLERKYDEAMTEYYKAFLAMCKRSCGLKLLDDEVNYPDMPVEPLPEDKARRCLERIELLRRVREDILSHPRLGERLALCRPSSELPEWWIPGRHDRELVLGAAKHGLGRTDCYILNDPELSFRDFVREGNLRSKEPQMADVSKESEVGTKGSGWNEEGGPKDVLQMEGDEMIVKLEKGEGTLKIERIGGKKEPKVTEEKKTEEAVVKEEVEEVKKEEEAVQEEEKVEEEEVPEAVVKEEPVEAGVKTEEGQAEVKTEVKSEEEMEGVEIKEESEVKKEDELMEAESTVKEEENVPLDLKAEGMKEEEDEVEKMEVEEPVEKVEEKEASEEKPKSPPPSPKEAVEEKATTEEEPMQVEQEKIPEEEEKVEEEPKEISEPEKEETPKEDGEAKVQEESEPVEEKKEEFTEEKESEEVSADKEEEKEMPVEVAKEEEEKKVEETEVEEKEKEQAKEEEGGKVEEEIVEEKKTAEGEAVVGEEEKVEEPKKAEAPAPEIEIVPVTEPKEEAPKENEVQCLAVTNQDTAVTSSTSVYWPKDRVLQTRLEQIVHLVEHGEWPSNNTSCLLPLQSQSMPTSAQSSIVAMGSSMARLVGGLLGALGNLQAGRGMQGKGLMGDGLMGADVARSLAELKGGASGLPSSDVVTITTTTADHVTLAPVQRQRQMPVQQSLLPPSLSGMGRRGSELHMGRMAGSSSSPVAHQSSMGNLAPPTKKRKRHIAIDVETERAKLHALLNSSANQSSQKMSSMWGGDDDSPSGDASSRRMQGGMQPPPAHQQQGSTRVLSMPLSSYDLGKYHPSSSQASTPPSDSQTGGSSTPLIKSIGPTTIIPGTSSTLTPIDLSSGLPKVDSGNKNSSEAQDFSMSSKSKQKSKLDDMLDKLMKRKVCVEEPAGKEKKRRKLDEIVLGLSAAKEQSLFSDVKKSGTSITPIPLPASHSSQGRSRHGTSSPHQQQPASSKPFTITVTSVPPSQSRPSPQGSMHNQPPKCQRPPAPGRPPSSGHPQSSQSNPLQQQQQQQRMEQSSQMRSSQSSTAQQLLQQQNQRKSVYESMLADLGKVADFSRMGSYSHEAKVNKWLAEQTSMLPERSHSSMGQHSSGSSSAAQVVDLQSSMRRRRPRIDPSLLDWKKLSGEENISVINRVTGKKISGTKAPQLKSLGAWLVENPMFDIDPKWADLVKERGNLPRDLQKRLPPGITVATPGTSSSPTNSGDQRKKGPGRPMSSSHSQGAPTSSSGFPASSAPSPVTSSPSLSTLAAGLSNLNPALLSGLGLGAFDPKNNPLLMPFTRGTGSNSAAGALPSLGNMGALAGLGGLGGVSNLSLANSLFANLAGLNLPSMDSSSQSESRGNSSGGTSGTSSNKNRKSEGSKGSSTPNIPTSSAFPFFFPNPSLLYNPLGLGGINPFSLQPGMNPAYDTLAQQCRLLNGVSTSTSTPTSNTTSTTSSSAGRPSTSQNSRGRPSLASNHRHRPRDAKEALEKQQRHLQRLLNAQGLGQLSGDLELSEATEGSSAGKNGETPGKTEQEVSEERTGKLAASAAEGGPSPNDAPEDCGESPSQSTQRAKAPAGAGMGGSATKRPRPTRLEETVSKLKESVVEKKSSKSASEEGKGEGTHSPSASGGEEEKEA